MESDRQKLAEPRVDPGIRQLDLDPYSADFLADPYPNYAKPRAAPRCGAG